MKVFLFSTALFILLAGDCIGQKPVLKNNQGWTAVYANDENGVASSGSLQSLIEGLRKGYSLKIGWSWTRRIGDSTVTLEHFAEPIFISIIQEKNVSAIIDPHPLLKNYINIDQQVFDNPANIWQCVLTTTGSFNAMVYNRTSGEVVRNWPQKHKMVWYLEYP